jgi:hypothetical protein
LDHSLLRHLRSIYYIKAKNQKIDDLIESELKKNQNPKSNFKYSYPKISEIKQETRLDTGIYEREFKEIDFYPWSIDEHVKLSELFGFKLMACCWDNDRIYAEWCRS